MGMRSNSFTLNKKGELIESAAFVVALSFIVAALVLGFSNTFFTYASHVRNDLSVERSFVAVIYTINLLSVNQSGEELWGLLVDPSTAKNRLEDDLTCACEVKLLYSPQEEVVLLDRCKDRVGAITLRLPVSVCQTRQCSDGVWMVSIRPALLEVALCKT